jgi:hypothetical protein
MLDRGAAIHDDAEAGLVSDPGGLPVHDAELQPKAARTGRDRLLRVGDAELGPAEDVDDVERSRRRDGLGQRAERRDAEDRPFVRVDRDALVALAYEVAEDPERRAPLVRRCPDNRNPVARPEDVGDPGVVEQGYRTALLGEVEERDRPGPLGPPGGRGGIRVGGCTGVRGPVGPLGPVRVRIARRQVVASRWYGWPSAAGGVLRPMSPARTMIVTMYGSALNV